MNLDNWETIAKQVGAIGDNGNESSSSHMALKAIEILLGEDELRKAVHYYIEGRPGSELLRGVLWQLHPWCAMEECYLIFKSHPDVLHKRFAVELLRVVADRRALEWVQEFLQYNDSEVQQWGIGVIDQLFFSELCYEEEITDILEIAIKHSNIFVREKAEDIQSMVIATTEKNKIVDDYMNNRHNKSSNLTGEKDSPSS